MRRISPLALLPLLLSSCVMKRPVAEPVAVDTRGYATDCVQTHGDSGFRSVRVQFVIQPDGQLDPSSVRILEVRRNAAQERLGGSARASVMRYLETCRLVPASLAGERVSYTHEMWVSVSDRD